MFDRFDDDFNITIHRSLAKSDAHYLNSFLAMENRQAWEEGPGGLAKGARYSVIWSPLICSKHTLLRLLNFELLDKKDLGFILSMFRFRDDFIRQYVSEGTTYLRSLFLFSETWDLNELVKTEPWQEADVYRVYIVTRLVHAFSLIILSPSTKKYQIVCVAENSGELQSFKTFSNVLFAKNLLVDGALGVDWKEGSVVHPHIDWLSTVDCVVPNKTLHAIFVIYVIYYLFLEVPVYFRLDGASGKTLRENLAYYCLKGNLPY